MRTMMGTALTTRNAAGWKATALAVLNRALSNVGFGPGSPRLKPKFDDAGFGQAKARRFRRAALNRRGSQRLLAFATIAASMLLATGCSRAPSFNLLGSFFPAWLLCGVLGITLAVITRVIFVRMNFEKELAPLILVYPCLALFYTFSIWLVFFS